MSYEPKIWDVGSTSLDLDDAIAKIVDENVGEALKQIVGGMIEDATIDGDGIWLIDTNLPEGFNFCISLKDAVDESVKRYSGPGSDDSTLQWLRDARALLLSCVDAIDKVL